MVAPLKSWSEPSLQDLKLSPQETENLGKYIRTCEIDRKVCAATDKMLTDCEFRNKCRAQWKPFVKGVVVGALAALIFERVRD